MKEDFETTAVTESSATTTGVQRFPMPNEKSKKWTPVFLPISFLDRTKDDTYLVRVESKDENSLRRGWIDKGYYADDEATWYDDSGTKIERSSWVITAFAPWPDLREILVTHASDCSANNEPAFPNGPCNCGAELRSKPADAPITSSEPTGDRSADSVAARENWSVQYHAGNSNICRVPELKIRKLPACEGGSWWLPRNQAEFIAAAPDMLDALRRVVSAYDAYPNWPDRIAQEMKFVREAVAKATRAESGSPVAQKISNEEEVVSNNLASPLSHK